MQKSAEKNTIDIKSALVLILTPIAAVILIPYYAINYGFSISDWICFIFFMTGTGLSITAGYHRLWSHRSYKAKAPLKIFFMLFGAAALQNSIIKWSSDHRKHHRHVDNKNLDPYAATKGFWYSHFTWMLIKLPNKVAKIEKVDDLKKDKVVSFQHKYYNFLAIFMCVLLPMIIGASYNSIWGCLLLSGLLRLVLNHHFTFLVNSLAHFWGKQKFSNENTACDNPMLSLLTYGEGYHNYHHKYSGDYRNGIKWYDFDPSKWLIFLASKIGWAYDLKTTPKPIIEAAKASMQLKKVQSNLEYKKVLGSDTSISDFEKQLEIQYQLLFNSIKDWGEANQACKKAKKNNLPLNQINQLKEHYKILKKKFEAEKRVWLNMTYSSTKLSGNLKA